MLIELKKYFSGEDVSQHIDYTIDLSGVEIDGAKPFVSRCMSGDIKAFASVQSCMSPSAMRFRCRATGA